MVFVSELPVDRGKRWELLERFLGSWFPPREGSHGVAASDLDLAQQRLGLSLPVALREWYGQFGARDDVWSLQDRLLMPRELEVERDVLVVCVENQGVVRWGIRLEDMDADDPPVVVSDPDGSATWFVESPTTTAFAAQFAVMNAKWSETVRYHANGSATGNVVAAVDRSYAPLRLKEMHWPAWPTRFYGGDDILIETHGDSWIWATARSPSALARLDAIVREAGTDDWEAYED